MKTKSRKMQKGDRVFNIIMALIGIVIILVIMYPLYFIVIASFSSPTEVSAGHVWLLPKAITFEGYRRIFEDARIWVGYRNTIAYTVVGTGLSLLFTLPAGYALSRKDLKGRGFFMAFFMITMFFNGGLIPTFLTIQKFNLLDTFWVIVLPFAVSVYNLIIVRTFFSSNVPGELWEAAQLDGCSHTTFFIKVVLPISKAIVAVIALYCAVGQWNQYFNSLIYTRKASLMSLQLVLRNILLQNKVVSGTSGVALAEMQKIADIMKYGVIIVSTLPILCVYPFLQKYFDQGVMIGSVKG